MGVSLVVPHHYYYHFNSFFQNNDVLLVVAYKVINDRYLFRLECFFNKTNEK